jgi:hypothetical protein
MNGILNLLSVFSMIFRVIGNRINKSSVNGIIKKLEENHDYRLDKADEMYFTVGKVISPEYNKVFRNFKEKIAEFKTDKFEVKGVYDLNIDSFLVFVICTDFDVELGRNGNNNLSKFIKLLYFSVKRIAKESKVEMCTYTFEDLHDKNLLEDFYMKFAKTIK